MMVQAIKQMFFIVAVMVCMVGSARAASWQVEQDGTGDFMVIQDAVDVAADGDTILIGPGHYQDMHSVQVNGTGYVVDAVVNWFDSRSLVFIGTGPDDVLIGPESYAPSFPGPIGFYQQDFGDITISGISFQNFYQAIYSVDGSEVSNCRFTGCKGGIVEFYGPALVRDCEFTDARDNGANVDGEGSPEYIVENCTFQDARIYFSGGTNFSVNNCIFEGKMGTIYGAHGVLSNIESIIDDQFRLAIDGGSVVEIRDSTFHVSPGGRGALFVAEGGTTVNLTGNIFSGGDWATLDFQTSCTVTASGNHFLNPSGDFVVRTDSWPNPNVGSLDLRNNYWGTDDSSQIGQSIYDGYDDPGIEVYVQYSPFSDVPLPSEQKTLGDIKAQYR